MVIFLIVIIRLMISMINSDHKANIIRHNCLGEGGRGEREREGEGEGEGEGRRSSSHPPPNSCLQSKSMRERERESSSPLFSIQSKTVSEREPVPPP